MANKNYVPLFFHDVFLSSLVGQMLSNAKAIKNKTCVADWLVWKAERGYCLSGLYAPVAQMDQSGRFLNGKTPVSDGLKAFQKVSRIHCIY